MYICTFWTIFIIETWDILTRARLRRLEADVTSINSEDNSASNTVWIVCFISSDINNHGRSGTVAHYCAVAWATMAPCAKPWSIEMITTHQYTFSVGIDSNVHYWANKPRSWLLRTLTFRIIWIHRFSRQRLSFTLYNTYSTWISLTNELKCDA